MRNAKQTPLPPFRSEDQHLKPFLMGIFQRLSLLALYLFTLPIEKRAEAFSLLFC